MLPSPTPGPRPTVNLLSLRILERWGMARMELLGALAAAVVVAVAVALWQGLGGPAA